MSQSAWRAAVLCAALAAAALSAGCGDQGSAPVAQQSASAPPAATATAPAAVPTTATPTTTAETTAPASTAPTATTGVPPGGPATGESQPGGAGDEEAIRVPAAFRVADGAITPSKITVPAFLPIALAITSVGTQRTVTVDAPDAGALDIAAGGTARRTVPGLKPGDYAITADGGGRAVLHVTPGGDAGP